MERFDFLKNIDKKYYASNFYDIRVNKYGVKYGTLLRFWENKGLSILTLMGAFNGIADTILEGDLMMIKDK